VQAGAVPITSLQYVFELQQDWARTETYEGVMEILRAHSPYGHQVRFSKWALGEHASEAGPAPTVHIEWTSGLVPSVVFSQWQAPPGRSTALLVPPGRSTTRRCDRVSFAGRAVPKPHPLAAREPALGRDPGDDLAGHVLAQEPWEVVRLPAIAHDDGLRRVETVLSDHASNGNPTYCSANDAWACSEACR
jgi:hypothetical protein